MIWFGWFKESAGQHFNTRYTKRTDDGDSIIVEQLVDGWYGSFIPHRSNLDAKVTYLKVGPYESWWDAGQAIEDEAAFHEGKIRLGAPRG